MHVHGVGQAKWVGGGAVGQVVVPVVMAVPVVVVVAAVVEAVVVVEMGAGEVVFSF